jgi:hypothetical protein
MRPRDPVRQGGAPVVAHEVDRRAQSPDLVAQPRDVRIVGGGEGTGPRAPEARDRHCDRVAL